MLYKILIKNENTIYAHQNNEIKETLINHLDDTLKVFYNIDKIYNITDKFDKSFKNMVFKFKGKEFKLSISSLSLLKEMFIQSIPMHDIGKMNPKFQTEKMDNKLDDFMDIKSYDDLKKYLSGMDSYHSKLSALIYIDYFFKEIMRIKSQKEKIILTFLLLVFANIIMCHHSNLDNLEDNLSENKLKEYISSMEVSKYKYLDFYNHKFELKPEIGRVLNQIKKIDYDTITVYIWNKILYSSLTACDFIASYSFFKEMNVDEFQLNNITNISDLLFELENTKIYKDILSYKDNNNHYEENGLPLINNLRADIFLECRENLLNNKDNMIFNIESPTGSGKTFNSISCALNLLNNQSKLIYVFPSNTLSNQTKNVLSNIFNNKLDVNEINSITPLPLKVSKDGSIDYDKVLLDRQLFNYENIVTSNVAFYNLLFGCNRNMSMGLISLFNSTIILDEIQNYKNDNWRESIELLYKFSEIMNIKIIKMSATLPNLENLIGFEHNKFTNLLEDRNKYYKNSAFKDRVKIERISTKPTYEDLFKLIKKEIKYRNKLEKGHSKFLIEFITKKSAFEFYNYIQDKLPSDYISYELDGDSNNFVKTEVIKKCKEDPKKNIILVTTQVIEAGIDIDFDLGAKDSVFPDTDEQFLGRINRSANKNNCKAFFFKKDNEELVYKKDYRIGTNVIKNDVYYECLLNKDFDIMYQKVYKEISVHKNTCVSSSMNHFYNNKLKLIKNKNIYKHMKLIDEETFEIFIPNTINGINGEDVWNEYKKIIKNKSLSYAKKKTLLINMKQHLSYFTYKVHGKGIFGETPIYGMYYIKDGINYIQNNKFNRDLFKLKYQIIK